MTTIHLPSPLPTDFTTRDLWELPPLLADAEARLHRLAESVYADLEVVSYSGRTWGTSGNLHLDLRRCQLGLLAVSIV